MDSFVFFGKGGIGKSTTSSNVSAALAALGHRVLHVGCDPKHDSTVPLLSGQLLEPVVDRIQSTQNVTPEDIVTRSHLGIDCVEAGGPAAGVGCGGRGVSRMLEIFSSAKLLTSGRYDVAVYDVLGDVVCGGFAAPLRKGVGEKVVIVTSEEVMSLYAANNIAHAIVHYKENGVALAGLVANVRDGEDVTTIERFARTIGTRILAVVPRDPLVREAEYRRKTVVEHAPASNIARSFRAIAEMLLAIDPKALALPTPLAERDFYRHAEHRFDPPSTRVEAPVPELPPALASELVNNAAVIPVNRLVRGQASVVPAPVATVMNFQRELSAGRRAVRLGRVRAEEAMKRLREAFPHDARELLTEDLLA